MLFDREVKKCIVCELPTLVHQCREDKDGFVCKWCDKVKGYWELSNGKEN